MKSKTKPTELQRLTEVWYKKLSKAGFKDIEDSQERLLEYHNTKYSVRDPLAFASQQRYYELSAQLLHTHSFRDSEHRTIWDLHCQGRSNQSIAKRVNRSKYYVFTVIESLAKLIKV